MVASIILVAALSFTITAIVGVMAQGPTPPPPLPTPGPGSVPPEARGGLSLEERLRLDALAEAQGLKANFGGKITVGGVVIQLPADTYDATVEVNCSGSTKPCDSVRYFLRRGHSAAYVGAASGNTNLVFAPEEKAIFDFLLPFVTVRNTDVRPGGCAPPLTITSPITDISC